MNKINSKNRGQIFSLDLIFATILLIFFIGVLINVVELKHYEKKENILINELQFESETSLNLLIAGEFSCEYQGIKLSSTINPTKIIQATNEEIIDSLALYNKNFEILINNNPIKINGELSKKNLIVYELNILTCEEFEEELKINDLLLCLNNKEECELKKEKLVFKVSR